MPTLKVEWGQVRNSQSSITPHIPNIRKSVEQDTPKSSPAATPVSSCLRWHSCESNEVYDNYRRDLIMTTSRHSIHSPDMRKVADIETVGSACIVPLAWREGYTQTAFVPSDRSGSQTTFSFKNLILFYF